MSFLNRCVLACVLCFAVALAVATSAPGESDDFLQVTGPCRLEFPRDHGGHPGYRTEWWYYTGNVETDDGRRYGFQFTIFRRQLRAAESPSPRNPGERSAWRTNQIYIGHAAVSDIGAKRHHHAETMSRGIEMLAGIRRSDDTFRIHLKAWEAVISPERHRLKVDGPDFGYELELAPEKPPVLHGESGYSRKGAAPDRASCYYSLTRLRATGTLRIGAESVVVRGLAWMDHEYSSAYLEPGLAGWDWFSLQLSDETELMVFLMRRNDGARSPFSSGTFVGKDGGMVRLDRESFDVTPGGEWRSARSGAVYPLKWRIDVPRAGLTLAVEAAFPDQEMETPRTTGVTYWEGSVSATGSRAGRPVTGRGYVEMTGRTGKGFEAPL
ncbi:MAG: lipocalin-like domain-containing protein [Desulfobacterales bacterium]